MGERPGRRPRGEVGRIAPRAPSCDGAGAVGLTKRSASPNPRPARSAGPHQLHHCPIFGHFFPILGHSRARFPPKRHRMADPPRRTADPQPRMTDPQPRTPRSVHRMGHGARRTTSLVPFWDARWGGDGARWAAIRSRWSVGRGRRACRAGGWPGGAGLRPALNIGRHAVPPHQPVNGVGLCCAPP